MKDFAKYSVFAVLLGIGAGTVFWYLTGKHHLLIYGDSSIYMELAQNLADGKGYKIWHDGHFIFYPFYPPLYPLLLGAIHKLTGWSFLFIGRMISLLALEINLWLLYRIAALIRIEKPYRILLPVLFLFSWLHPLFYILITEHLFLTFFLANVFFFLRRLQNGETKSLATAGFFAGLMLLTRYAALGIILPQTIYLLWKFRKKAIRSLAAYLLPLILLYAPWQYFILIRPHSGIYGRRLAFHPPGLDHWKELIVTLANWLAPGLTLWLTLPVAFLIFWLLYRSFRVQRPRHWPRFMIFFMWIGVGYFIFVLLSVSLADFTTPLDNRILSPLYLLLLTAGIFALSQFRNLPAAKILIGLILASYTLHYVDFNRSYYNGQVDVIRIKSPQIVRLLRHSPQRIYSNAIDIIKLDIPQYQRLFDLPDHYHRMTLHPNPAFDKQILRIRREVADRRALVVYFYGFDFRKFQATTAEIKEVFRGLPVYDFGDGLIIGYPENWSVLTSGRD